MVAELEASEALPKQSRQRHYLRYRAMVRSLSREEALMHSTSLLLALAARVDYPQRPIRPETELPEPPSHWHLAPRASEGLPSRCFDQLVMVPPNFPRQQVEPVERLCSALQTNYLLEGRPTPH